MKSVSFIGLAIVGMLLAGCGGDTSFSDIKAKMADKN